ncbi:tyrosine-type recombinase/integrase [Paenibacillus sp. M-152]|uniref:tyrosine-type recombinase/integrase n=1 Tax=Paenibacillus sp. M-152 TaxID=2487928 RepID=UPI000F6CF008|nr:tyrosine-type recombinase/integrase [Paenibacillus sp. M-152]AZH30117.1 site-specific integrase [Paenibacillus sp. M-152]
MNQTEPNIILRKDNSHKLKYILVNKIDQLGNFKFSDDSWYFYRLHNNNLPRGNYTIYFYQVPDKYKDWVKFYALSCTSGTSQTQKKVLKIAYFLKFLQNHHNSIVLEKVTRTHINAFEFELKHSELSINTRQCTYASIQDFFIKLSDFPEMPNVLPVKQINPFKQSRRGRKELLPSKVLRAWDRAMKNESLAIPLELRVVYWLLRSFPNRITEVLSLKHDCLKTFFSEYVLQMPTYKQNGGYSEPEVKQIPIIYAGHGKYIVDLIKKLQLQTQMFVSTFPLSKHTKKEYLFTIRYWNFDIKRKDFSIRYNRNLLYNNHLQNWTGPKVNDLFEQLATILDIRDSQGTLVIPKTHLFRHQAVSDRLYTVGYTIEQIRKLTGHKNQAMPNFYTHQLIEKHKEIHLGISELKNPKESSYEFRGKILNLDERTVKQLSKNPKRYLTWEANGKKGVGICSDITGCNPKGTSVHFECYACSWFVPKLDYLDDYKAELLYWLDVMNRNADNPTRVAHFENAIRNVSYLERIVKICESGIKTFQEELVGNKLENEKIYVDWE